MARVIVAEPAKQDVRDILTDLSGPPRPALGPNARIMIVHPDVIIYDHESNEATVLRVLHGRRDVTIKLIKG